MMQFEERHRPSKEQIECVMNNCDYVLNPDGQKSREELMQFIDQATDPRVLIVLFIVNTCEMGLQSIDDFEEKRHLLDNCSLYFGMIPNGDIRLHDIAYQIFDCMCSPIPILRNSDFIKIWSNIIEYVSIAVEDKMTDDDFPRCLYQYFD